MNDSEFDDLIEAVLTEGEGETSKTCPAAAPSSSVSTDAHQSEPAGGVEGSVGQSADDVGPEAPDVAIGSTGQEVGLTAGSDYPYFKPDPKPKAGKERKRR